MEKKYMNRLDIVLADKNADRRMPFVHRTLNCLSMKYNNSIVVASLYLYVLLHSFNCIRNATAQPPTDRVWYSFSCYNILFDHFTHNQWHTHTAHSPNTETHILHLGGSAKNPNQWIDGIGRPIKGTHLCTFSTGRVHARTRSKRGKQ